jgi:hypothetical protein
MAVRVITGDCREVLRTLPDASVHCVVTSPPIEILAYAAGVIDSDGSIGIRRSTYAARHGQGTQPVFSARVCCKQITPEAVSLLKEMFGGSLMLQPPSVTRGKPLHYWEVHSRQAVQCLRLVLPFLRIKRVQAENCIALYALVERSKCERVAYGRGHAGSASRDPALTAAMEAHWVRAKELNRVGVVTP